MTTLSDCSARRCWSFSSDPPAGDPPTCESPSKSSTTPPASFAFCENIFAESTCTPSKQSDAAGTTATKCASDRSVACPQPQRREELPPPFFVTAGASERRRHAQPHSPHWLRGRGDPAPRILRGARRILTRTMVRSRSHRLKGVALGIFCLGSGHVQRVDRDRLRLLLGDVCDRAGVGARRLWSEIRRDSARSGEIRRDPARFAWRCPLGSSRLLGQSRPISANLGSSRPISARLRALTKCVHAS